MFYIIILMGLSKNLGKIFTAEELERSERYTCVFPVDAIIHPNTAETTYTFEQLARGESNSSYYLYNSITHDYHMLPLFLEVQPIRRETCIDVLSCGSRANTNNFETSFAEARHSGNDGCVTTFDENPLTHGNNAQTVFTEGQLRECETSNVPHYSVVHSNGVESIFNEEQTVIYESADFVSGGSTIHVANNETVFTEEQLARFDEIYLSTFPIAHVYDTVTIFTGDQLERQHRHSD